MKKLTLLFLFISVVTVSCTSGIEVTPIREQTGIPDLIPDFNFLAKEGSKSLLPNNDFVYRQVIQLYLRPFENVTSSDKVTLLFESDAFSELEITGVVLLPGDKLLLDYAQFDENRLFVRYTTKEVSSQTVSFSASIRGVTKKSTVSFTTK